MSEQKMSLPWFKPQDFDAALGVFFDGFTKVLVGVSVLVGVFKMPNDLIFSKIVVGIGVASLLLLGWNTMHARAVGIKTKNKDITALPGGLAGGSFFVWLFGIMMPVYFSTNDPITAWKVGVIAHVIYSIIFFVFTFVIKALLKYIPSSALLGSSVGGAIAWLLMSTLGEGFSQPIVIIPTFFILLTLYLAKIDLKKLSPSVIAIGTGTIIAWTVGIMSKEAFINSFSTVGFYFPTPQFELLNGLGASFKTAANYLPLIFAFVVADITATIQAVEQARACGIEYNERTCLLGSGSANLISCIFGNPFPVSHYWGFPAWKSLGAGTIYPLITGLLYFLLCASGLVAIATSILPVGATVTLLIFAAISTGAQAFISCKQRYYPAMVIGIALPIFELLYGKINNAISGTKNAIAQALTTAGIDYSVLDIAVSSDILASAGLAKGYLPLSQGSMLLAICYVAALSFITDKDWLKTGFNFLVLSFFSFIGLIHSANVTVMAAPLYMYIYLSMAVVFFAFHIFDKSPKPIIE